MKTPKQLTFDKKVSDEIVSLKNDGKKWGEISDAVGIPVGKCMLIYSFATVAAKDKIKNATGEDIVRLRDKENISWGDISARTGYPESACRSLYTETTGKTTKGLRIGKGGRHPGPQSESAPKKASGTTKKAAAKAAPAEKNELDGLDPQAVKDRITGFALKVRTDGGGEEVIKVKSVKKVSATSIVLTDHTGQGRTVKRAAIFQVSAKKVIKG